MLTVALTSVWAIAASNQNQRKMFIPSAAIKNFRQYNAGAVAFAIKAQALMVAENFQLAESVVKGGSILL